MQKRFTMGNVEGAEPPRAGRSCFQLWAKAVLEAGLVRSTAAVTARGRVEPLTLDEMSLMEMWTPQLSGLTGRTIFDPYQDDANASRAVIGGERLAAYEEAARAAVQTLTFTVPYRIAYSPAGSTSSRFRRCTRPCSGTSARASATPRR